MQRKTFKETQRDREGACIMAVLFIITIGGFIAAIALPEIMEALR